MGRHDVSWQAKKHWNIGLLESEIILRRQTLPEIRWSRYRLHGQNPTVCINMMGCFLMFNSVRSKLWYIYWNCGGICPKIDNQPLETNIFASKFNIKIKHNRNNYYQIKEVLPQKRDIEENTNKQKQLNKDTNNENLKLENTQYSHRQNYRKKQNGKMPGYYPGDPQMINKKKWCLLVPG